MANSGGGRDRPAEVQSPPQTDAIAGWFSDRVDFCLSMARRVSTDMAIIHPKKIANGIQKAPTPL
jgi:hypothetical protein